MPPTERQLNPPTPGVDKPLAPSQRVDVTAVIKTDRAEILRPVERQPSAAEKVAPVPGRNEQPTRLTDALNSHPEGTLKSAQSAGVRLEAAPAINGPLPDGRYKEDVLTELRQKDRPVVNEKGAEKIKTDDRLWQTTAEKKAEAENTGGEKASGGKGVGGKEVSEADHGNTPSKKQSAKERWEQYLQLLQTLLSELPLSKRPLWGNGNGQQQRGVEIVRNAENRAAPAVRVSSETDGPGQGRVTKTDTGRGPKLADDIVGTTQVATISEARNDSRHNLPDRKHGLGQSPHRANENRGELTRASVESSRQGSLTASNVSQHGPPKVRQGETRALLRGEVDRLAVPDRKSPLPSPATDLATNRVNLEQATFAAKSAQIKPDGSLHRVTEGQEKRIAQPDRIGDRIGAAQAEMKPSAEREVLRRERNHPGRTAEERAEDRRAEVAAERKHRANRERREVNQHTREIERLAGAKTGKEKRALRRVHRYRLSALKRMRRQLRLMKRRTFRGRRAGRQSLFASRRHGAAEVTRQRDLIAERHAQAPDQNTKQRAVEENANPIVALVNSTKREKG